MRFEATIQEIRALLQLVEFDAEAPKLPLELCRSRREASRQRVLRPLLERYEILIEAGRRPPIVAIERGACSGCHIRLPTMLESRARRSPAVHTCPSCRRMLYAPDLLVAEEPSGPPPRKRGRPHRSARASAADRS
jgi:predicted  nucleic acid-binding Zn-ribbon protein